MDDDKKAVVPEQAVDANPTDPSKVEPAVIADEMANMDWGQNKKDRSRDLSQSDAAKVPDVRNCGQTPTPEPVDVNAPLTLRIKVHGEEKEVTLTRDELIAKVQLAEDYQLKTAALAANKRKVAPFLHVFKSDAFHAWLADQPTEGTKHLEDRDLHGLMKKGMTIAAVELILRRGSEAF